MEPFISETTIIKRLALKLQYKQPACSISVPVHLIKVRQELDTL